MAKAPVVRRRTSPGDPCRRRPPATGRMDNPGAQASVAASRWNPFTRRRRGRATRVEFLKAMEREELQTALSSAGWVIARAAKILGGRRARWRTR